MKKRELGNTGMRVSPLGLGTVKLGRDRGVKYPTNFTIPDDKQALALINAARESGINLIDTAPAYGNSEERLGTLLKGQRQKWIICSKVGEEFDNLTGESRFDFSPTHTRASIERSLKRLDTDYIDMVLVHSDGNDEAIIATGILEQLEEIKQAGLIRATGMSTKTVTGGLIAAERSDVVMVTYNPGYRDEEPVLDYCRDNQKGALIKKALGSGHLCLEGEDPVENSMRFIFAHGGVSSAIVGTINPLHLADNIRAVEKAQETP